MSSKPNRANGLGHIASLFFALAVATPFVGAQGFEITLNNASAEVDLHFSDGFGFMGTGGDFAQIVHPASQFAAFAEATTVPFTTFFGRGAAYQDQFGINAVFVDTEEALGDANLFEGSAETNFDVDIIDRGPIGGGTIPFTFVINGGEVRIRNVSNLDTFPFHELSPVVSVTAEVTVDGQRWRFTTGLSTTAAGDVVEVGDIFGNVDNFGLDIFPSLTVETIGDDAFITIPTIEGTIDIDHVEFSSSRDGVNFQYDMLAEIDIMNSFGVGALAGITDPFALGNSDPSDDLGGPFSPLGVQFFLDGQPLSNFPVRVPEPATVLLTLCNLFALLAIRCRANA